jgi:NitT/TauT family transport system substrate-binding protein
MKATARSLATRAAAALAALACCAFTAAPSFAEVSEVRIAKGFGIGYLPLIVMEDEKLFEKHA